ncbi:hypothetical protein KBP30_08740 [Streptomyces sp. Go40/10]|uniref:hypothetical protein n=1 Tax=Streptomyces sp. Go40/10 TaxID=2825844 RepID=UPI001E3C64A4|nr:hypothetical protein [Streptomyces sp. Go40/10]UFR01259.1 hypothetical protein KBP30_08740 [Streptomyces sp. Go40/10]
MSTTGTSADTPRPRRRRAGRYVPFPGRSTQQTTGPLTGPVTGRLPADRPSVPENRSDRRLLAEAGKRGRRDGRKRTLDPWVLNSGDRLPYLAELASLRDAVIHRIEENLNRTEETARLQDARAESDVTAGEAETRLLDERLREADQAIQEAKSQLNLLALRSSRWIRFRDRLREGVEERWLRERFRDAPGPPAGHVPAPADPGLGDDGSGMPDGKAESGDTGDDWQTVSTAGTAPDDTSRAALREEYIAARRRTDDVGSAEGWEGLATRPGLPRWLTLVLLLVIMAVEVPVYWVAYQPFHGVGSTSGDALSGTLAVSSAVLMLILPHLAGHMLRWRAATGSPRSGWLPSLSLLGVWGGLTWVLGTLRARFVMQHDPPAPTGGAAAGFRGLGGSSAGTSTLVDRLHLTSQTVTWLFCALLLLSGGVGFLLGLFREHPFLDAYRTAVERRTDLQRQRERSIADTERARAAQTTAEDRRQARRDAASRQIACTRELYEAAAAKYLDGVREGANDTAVSESVMRLSRAQPVLPAPRGL